MKWILILGALTLFSCQEKVDCQKLEERVTGCEKEFHKRLNPEKPYNSKRLHELVHSKLTKSCKNRGGKVGDASKINGCLKRTTCAAFVDCIVGKRESTVEQNDIAAEYAPQRGSNLKKIAFIALPVVATFIMSVGVFISRANIKGWITVHGSKRVAPASRSVFRIMARKGKLSKPVKKLSAKAFLETPEKDYLMGEGRSLWTYQKVIDLQVTYPPLPDGKYKVRLEIDSDMGSETWKIPVTLSRDGTSLTPHYEDAPGDEGSTYETKETSFVKKDKDGIIVSLHPSNGRGLKKRARDLLFIKAQREDGTPVRVKAKLAIVEGVVRLPTNTDCLPFMVGRDRMDCMVELKEKEEIPFSLSTDALGLDSMTIYTMSHGVTFKIEYQYKKRDGSWSKTSTVDFDVGSIEDDTYLSFLPRILPADKRFKLKVKGLGRGPFYLSVFTDQQWFSSKLVGLENYYGTTVLNTKGMRGYHKLQYTLSYLPVVNTIANFSLWIHNQVNDPQIMEDALKRVLKLKDLDPYMSTYVKKIKKAGLHWKAGYDLKSDIHFFAGLLDRFHYAQEPLLNTKHKRQSKLNNLKRSGQIAVFLIMTVSGLALIIVIFFAVFLFIRRRQRSIVTMSAMLDEAGVEENFFKDLSSTADEVDSRRQAIAFGFIVACIVGFVIVASIWLMLHIKWEM